MQDNAKIRNTRETKDNRRSQLIDATVKVISDFGLSNTTVAKVTQEARLSAGIVTFYFDSKEKLLLGTLKALSDEFRETIKTAIDSENEAEAKIYAIIDAYFMTQLCDIDKIAVWWAFCSESSARNEYMEICGEQDSWFQKTLVDLITQVCEKHKCDPNNANVLSRGMEGILDGLWQDYLFHTTDFDHDRARQICYNYLFAIFPGISRKSSDSLATHMNTDEIERQMTDQYLPVWTYYDTEFLELEKQALFKKNWLLVGHINDMPAPRDFLTLDAVDERAIVIRGNDNQIRAFHNVCRHRGAKLKDQPSGKCAHALTCPFHGWTYKLEGNLIGVTGTLFNDAETILGNLYYQQQLGEDDRGGFIAGRFDPSDFMDVLGYANPWTTFSNVAILLNPSIAFPDWSWGAGGGGWLNDQWYVLGSVNDANGTITDESFFDGGSEFFSQAEVGWSPSRAERYFTNVHRI